MTNGRNSLFRPSLLNTNRTKFSSFLSRSGICFGKEADVLPVGLWIKTIYFTNVEGMPPEFFGHELPVRSGGLYGLSQIYVVSKSKLSLPLLVFFTNNPHI
ncbi:hypothetical protein [Gelidibacter gilvus]|uniref:Uncharacterized protein n=1 Tax=Gelidibacter gilvus TaxID=59602 RepID=A0A4Q0XJ90_9FLAO|nr:hypothetical protein [Gelidibacter gilvus]RXJ51203.1 hypothetical protein ESZ48_04845 [Gelidibacter gilvus]